MRHLDVECKIGVRLILLILVGLIFFSARNRAVLNHSKCVYNIHYNNKCNFEFSEQSKNILKRNQLSDLPKLPIYGKNKIILLKKRSFKLNEPNKITSKKFASRLWRVSRNNTAQ